jgi:hypothetical protein
MVLGQILTLDLIWKTIARLTSKENLPVTLLVEGNPPIPQLA